MRLFGRTLMVLAPIFLQRPQVPLNATIFMGLILSSVENIIGV